MSTALPYVTKLTVDGEEVGSNHFINENQEVTISCLFDKGSPPQDFFLVDENQNKIKALRDEHHLNYSLTLGCKKNWQTIQCEGNKSVKNKSVLLFVKCKFSTNVCNFYLCFYFIYIFVISSKSSLTLYTTINNSFVFSWSSYRIKR